MEGEEERHPCHLGEEEAEEEEEHHPYHQEEVVVAGEEARRPYRLGEGVAGEERAVHQKALLFLSAAVGARAQAARWWVAMEAVRRQEHEAAEEEQDRAMGGTAVHGWRVVGAQHADQRMEEERQTGGCYRRCHRPQSLVAVAAVVVREVLSERTVLRGWRVLPAADAQTYRHRPAAGARQIGGEAAKGRVAVLAAVEELILSWPHFAGEQAAPVAGRRVWILTLPVHLLGVEGVVRACHRWILRQLLLQPPELQGVQKEAVAAADRVLQRAVAAQAAAGP